MNVSDPNAPMLRTLFPIFCSNSAIPACILSLCDRLAERGVPLDYWAPAVARGIRREYHRVPVPTVLSRIWYRLGLPDNGLGWALERRYLAALRPGDVAYLWPAVSLRTFREVAERGNTIVLERVNSHRLNSQKVLDEAYRRLGFPAAHDISVADARLESQKLEIADRVFSPSPFVRQSLVDNGVPEEKLFDTSYGWDPRTFEILPRVHGERRRPKFLFVANGTVRKGLAQLLEAWRAANLDATLCIVGPIEGHLAKAYERVLARPDVEHRPYHAQLSELYAEADAFVLASHEEGSPLVTYLALASGLPCLVSPAAAGGVVRDGIEGLVRHPYDAVGWVSALRELASDVDLRARLGGAAVVQAANYTWDRVAERRATELERLLGIERPPKESTAPVEAPGALKP